MGRQLKKKIAYGMHMKGKNIYLSKSTFEKRILKPWVWNENIKW